MTRTCPRRFVILLGDLGDLLLVERFGHQDDLPDPVRADRVVQCANAADPQAVEPVPVLPESGQQHGGTRASGAAWWRMAARVAQDKPFSHHGQPKPAQVARRRHHISVVVIPVTEQAVQHQEVLLPVAQQAHFIVQPFSWK